MSKYISESHIIGEAGVNAFATYCNRHQPYIIWREEARNDFGIDGEVEITAKNADGKLQPTGELIKIQLKSTRTGSYIRNKTDESFEFMARKADIEYWNKHNLDVILVVYFEDTEQLYAKKVSQTDNALATKKFPIPFDRHANELTIGESGFLAKFSHEFRKRISFDQSEEIITNMLPFFTLPKLVYEYEATTTDPKKIVAAIPRQERPIFRIVGKHVYTFADLGAYKAFRESFIKPNSRKDRNLKQFITEYDQRKVVSYLIMEHFRLHCGALGIYYNRDYGRYYFGLPQDEEERVILYRGKADGRVFPKTVVKPMEYYQMNFYRHAAFAAFIQYEDDLPYLVVIPKYLFTQDKREVLEDKKLITKLTNYLTAREFNDQYINQLHFIFQYLADGRRTLRLANYENAKIHLGYYQTFKVEFGIPLDAIKQRPETDVEQLSIGFDDED